MTEIFQDIPGFEGKYRASTLGNILSLRSKSLLKPWITQHGYRQLRLSDCKNIMKSFTICRLVAITFLPNPENKKCVNHKNGSKIDDRLENLEWATYSENTRHSFKLGLQSNKGVKHSQHKINEEMVREIRERSNMGEGLGILSVRYSLSKSHLSGIIHKRYWSHVK